MIISRKKIGSKTIERHIVFPNILDPLKKLIFWWANNKGHRDKTGKIIDDIKRRKHSKMIEKQITDGTIKLPERIGGKPRCYKVQSDGELVILKTDESGVA